MTYSDFEKNKIDLRCCEITLKTFERAPRLFEIEGMIDFYLDTKIKYQFYKNRSETFSLTHSSELNSVHSLHRF